MSTREPFRWHETYKRLEELHDDFVLEPAPHGFTAHDDRGTKVALFHAPLILPVAGRSAEEYIEEQSTPGSHTLLLIQAGSTAIGVWDDDELLRHKVIKKYVVRGSGRAQPAHLKTKGKSRYGSRLRLQNAKNQLVETNEKLIDYELDLGQSDRIYFSVPVRTWPELFRTTPPPPFKAEDARLHKIPLDVHVPNFEELERVRAWLARGRVEWLDEGEQQPDPTRL